MAAVGRHQHLGRQPLGQRPGRGRLVVDQRAVDVQQHHTDRSPELRGRHPASVCGRRPSRTLARTAAVVDTAVVDTVISFYHRVVPMISTRTDNVASAVSLFRGLADPARLAIVRHLALGDHRVVDLTAHLGLAQSTVSGHLSCLRDCGLVTVRAEGRASVYSLAHPELLDLLTAAERLLDATGEAVALCPAYGEEAS